MRLTTVNESTHTQLDNIARNVYTLLPDEYRVVRENEDFGKYMLSIHTDRRFDPIIKAAVSADRTKAEIFLYPGINSRKVLSDEDILEVISERYHFDSAYIKKDVLAEHSAQYRKGHIVENIKAVFSLPVVNGRDAVIQLLFERPSQKPKLLENGKVDYKNFTNFIMIKAGDVIIKRTPPTEGTKGFDVTGAEIFPIPGKDNIIDALDGVEVNEEKTEYKAKCAGHIVYTGTTISVSPYLQINGSVDYKTGNITFDGTVHVTRDVLPGFSVIADDIIIDNIDEDAVLMSRNSVNIKTGIKGTSGKGYIRAGHDVNIGYSENSLITAKGSIDIKKYCFNSILCADRIVTSSKDAIVTGGKIRALSLIHFHNVGSKGTNDMLLAVGISPELEERAFNIKAELQQLNETLHKIMSVLSQTDLKNPKNLKDPKVRKLLETASILKRKQPLLESRLKITQKNAIHPDPKIIIENKIRAGVKIQIYNAQIEVKMDMEKVYFFFDKDAGDVGFQPYNPSAQSEMTMIAD